MKIDSYLGAHLFFGTAIALMGLLAVLSLIDFVDEMKDIDLIYQLPDVLRYIGLTTPGRIYELLPVSVLIGGLVSFGNLAAQSELIALRAIGYSRKRIIFSMLGAGCVFVVLVGVIGETVVPLTEPAALRVRGDDDKFGLFQKTDVGIWSREGKYFIHAREVRKDGVYLDVSMYEFDDDNRLERIIFASSMQIENDRLILNDVQDARVEEARINMTRQTQLTIARAISLNEGTLGSVEPSMMSLRVLAKYIDFLKQNRLHYKLHELELWSKINQPLSVLVMLILGLPFVFSPVRSSTGQRLFYGILIGISYTLVSDLINNAVIVLDFPPVIGVFTPLLLGVSVGVGVYKLMPYR